MLELIVRIASAKYRQKKIVTSYHESVSMLFRDSFGEYLWTHNQFDYKHIWNYEINSLLKENDVILREIYKSNSGKLVEAGM